MKTFRQFIGENTNMVRAHMQAAGRRRKMANDPHWKNDKGMQKMFHDDADRHLSIADYIQHGHHDSAKRSFWNMDTDARDEVFVGASKKHAQKYYNQKKKVK